MKIKIVLVGKTKAKFLQQGEREFQRRLRPFCQLDWIIIKEDKIVSNKAIEDIKRVEAERILTKLSKSSFAIALDRTGEQMSSEEFAEFIQKKLTEGRREITFIIGGALGLGQPVLRAAAKILSLSQMTYTHEMSRLILLEQIYRAFTILRGSKYHKS